MTLPPNRRHVPLGRAACARTAMLVAIASAAVPSAVAAQRQRLIVDEGVLDLVLPTGARAVALGQATMAVTGTTESVWGNPSGLARMRGTSAAIHHSRS